MLLFKLVAGTSEPWVVVMYEEHLDAGTRAVTSVLEDSIKTLVNFVNFFFG